MNTILSIYTAYTLVSLGMTIWVARALHKNGRLFLVEAFSGNQEMADSVTRAEMSPRLATLLLGIFRSLGGCLPAVAVTAFVLTNGPVKRGERWASWTVLILIGLSEGINATQMWRFGSLRAHIAVPWRCS